MQQPYPIVPVSGPVAGSIRPPGSKSVTNRAALCAALARGRTTLHGPLDSEDTEVMRTALARLGAPVDVSAAANEWAIDGCGGRFPTAEANLDVANSGTTMRFLVAALAASPGRYRLDGVPRMRERPIADLLAALEQLGANVRSETESGCPPVRIEQSRLQGGVARLRGNVSSQFLSGLLMAAPLATDPVTIELQGPLVSQPYVTMTLEVMRSFGVEVSSTADLSRFDITPQTYEPQAYAIEPDASAASYFWAAAAITGGRVCVQGLPRDRALQGDVAFCDCLEAMGCEVTSADESITVAGRASRGIDVDMNAISDTVQTLAAVAVFADGPTTIRNVAHIRHKETDRIGDLATELRKIGAGVQETSDGMVIEPGKLSGASIETYRDHRMAMALSLVGLRIAGIEILDPGCVTKTYPKYFDDLAHLVSR